MFSTLTDIIPPFLSSTLITLREGDDFIVFCGSVNSRALNLGLPLWLNSNGEPAPQSDFRGGLYFASITREEAGVYNCILRSSDGRETDPDIATLEVIVEREFY